MPEGGLLLGAQVSDDDSDSECVFILTRLVRLTHDTSVRGSRLQKRPSIIDSYPAPVPHFLQPQSALPHTAAVIVLS